MSPSRLCSLVLCVAAFLHQVTATTLQASKSRPAKSPAPKRTPQQLHGLKMLRVAETEAAGLSPDMRAFLLLRSVLPISRSIQLRQEYCDGGRLRQAPLLRTMTMAEIAASRISL